MSKKQLNQISYEKKLEAFHERFMESFDITYRKIHTPQGEITVIFIDSISNKAYISEHIVEPLMTCNLQGKEITYIKDEVIEVGIVEKIKCFDEAIQHILSGNTVLLFSFNEEMIYCETKSYSNRAVEEPPTETAIKGSREGFTENIEDNISMLRKRIKSPSLQFEKLNIGSGSNTNVILVYIKDEAPENLVSYVRDRLKNIEVKYVMSSKYIDERLQEKRSFLDTIGYTEKPDIAGAMLVEGRVVVMVDNTPFVVTAPHFFIENFSVPDDYYLNKYTQSYFRIIRWSAFAIALLLPGLYLAIMTHHFKLIPTIFAFRLAVTRSGVPFPTVLEVVIMMYFFQVLREAGIRLPRPIGSALSIVGALILGDAAVGAGLTSEITVLIIALSSISLFLIPKLYGGIALWSNIIILFSVILGLPGFYIGFILFCSHVAGLTSCGYPYLYPLGTFKRMNVKEIVFRGDLRTISGNIFKEGEDK